MSKEIANLSMIPNKSGKIINMASIAGMGGNPKNLQMIAQGWLTPNFPDLGYYGSL